MRRLLVLPLAFLCASANAQSPAPASPAPLTTPAPKPVTVRVSLMTSEGPITLELDKTHAPITTANFLHYIDTKRFDGIAFYRATRVGPGYGLIQGGLRDPKKLFPAIAHEPTTATGLSHTDATISMARAAPGSATADFFIVIGDLVSMDADPKQPGDNLGFAAFGHVTEGMAVVRRILDAPTDPSAGEGVMRGQMLAAPIRIITARRAD